MSEQTNTATPDGPYYRTAAQTRAGEAISYVPAANLPEARTHVWRGRAWGLRTWIQVTHDLGRSWKDCADAGTDAPRPSESAAPDEAQRMRNALLGIRAWAFPAPTPPDAAHEALHQIYELTYAGLPEEQRTAPDALSALASGA